MSIVYKIILGLTSLGMLAFLVFFTFFDVQENVAGIQETVQLEKGKYLLSFAQNKYTPTPYSSGVLATGSTVFEKLNAFDTLFTNGEGVYTYKTSNSGAQLEISKGEFIILKTDFFTPLEYISHNFKISPQGIGKIYLKIEDEKYILFSLDGIFKVDLLGNDGKKVSSFTLYPHQYFVFNPKDIIYVFNADHLRLQSVFDYKYFPFPLLENNNTTNSGLQNIGINQDFLQMVYGYLISQEFLYTKELKKTRGHIGIYNIPGMSYIQKYTYLFFNQAKKEVYYKNILISMLQSIIQEDDSSKIEALEQEFLSKYQEYLSNTQQKEEIKMMIFDYYTKLLQISDDSFFLQQNSFGRLYQAIYGFKSHDIDFAASQLLIHNLYNYYDQNHPAGFYIRFVSFLSQYLKAIGVLKNKDVEETDTRTAYTLHDLEYLGFYLESILVSNLVESNNILASLNEILGKYNMITSLVYSQVDSTVKTTGLYINLELLRNIGTYVGNTYFVDRRTDKNLLEKKGGIQDIEAVKNLKKNFEEIKKFYDVNSQFLSDTDSRDIELKKHYDTIFSDYQEYFLALLDYDNYLLNFDPVSRALRDKLGYIDDTPSGSDILSESSLRKYLGQFVGLDITNAQIEVKNDMYSVTNAFISGKKISFDIYPFSGYELTNIALNDEQRRESYKLENIKDDWADKVLGSDGGKEYDFAQFFIYKFIAQKIVEQDTTQNPSPVEETYECPEETKAIRAFKIQLFDKAKSPFLPLNQILSINYKNLCVIGDQENIFEMKLQGPSVIFSGAGQLYGLMEGNFSLEQNISKFENIKLYPFAINPEGGKTYKWNKLPIIVRGFIPLTEFESNINAIGLMIPNVDMIVQSLSAVGGVQNTEINYFVVRKRMVIKFDFKGNKANIGLDATGVDSFIYSNKNILTEKASVADVIEIIANLK